MNSEKVADSGPAVSNPYVFFYPASASAVPVSHKGDIDAIRSTTTAKLDQKVRTDEFIRTKLSATQAFQEQNLKIVIKAFKGVAVDGFVSKSSFRDVLFRLSPVPADIDGEPFVDDVFNALAGVAGKGMDFVSFANALYDAVNGAKAAATSAACFATLDTTGCGNVLRRDLETIRESRLETAGVTHLMARHLIALIDSAREAAADAFVKGGPREHKSLSSGAPKAALTTVAIHQVIEEKQRVEQDAPAEREKASEKALRAKQGATVAARLPHEPFAAKTTLSLQEFSFLLLNDAILVQAFIFPILRCVARYLRA